MGGLQLFQGQLTKDEIVFSALYFHNKIVEN